MRRHAWFWLALGTGLAVSSTAGCKLLPVGSDGDDQVVYPGSHQDSRTLPDIPVPRGYNFREDRSFTYNRSFRTADLNYWRYGGTTQELVSFYREEMPLLDWRASGDSGEPTTLIFEKGTETCRVEVSESTGVTYVRVVIMPKAA